MIKAAIFNGQWLKKKPSLNSYLGCESRSCKTVRVGEVEAGVWQETLMGPARPDFSQYNLVLAELMSARADPSLSRRRHLGRMN